MFTQKEANLEDAVFVKRGISIGNLAGLATVTLVITSWIVFANYVLGWGNNQRIHMFAVAMGLVVISAPVFLKIRASLGEAYRLEVEGENLMLAGRVVEVETLEYGHVSDGGPWEAQLTVSPKAGRKLSLRCPQTRVLDLAERLQPLHQRLDLLVLAFPDRKAGDRRQSSLP